MNPPAIAAMLAGFCVAMGLDATRPLLLITGSSQGASGLNHLLMRSLSSLKQSLPELQYLHLTGSGDFDKVRAAYQAEGLRAIVRPFLTEMELALAATTVAVSQAGGSSLAELAAMRLPAILIPFPFAADDHQSHNALAFAQTGAAWMLPQRQAVPELFLPMLKDRRQAQRWWGPCQIGPPHDPAHAALCAVGREDSVRRRRSRPERAHGERATAPSLGAAG